MNIGVFDSGVGGLSILRQFIKRLPAYNYVYLGDSRNLPYGGKTPTELYRLTCKAIDYLAEKENCRLIILACNTASTVLRRIQQEYLPRRHPDVKVLGVIRPAAEAIQESYKEPVGIMATAATVRARSFIKELKKIEANPQVYQQACPVLVPLIEKGQLDGKRLRKAVDGYVGRLMRKGVKNILLGCTHYELIADTIERASGMPLILEGHVTAEKLASYLYRHREINAKLSRQGKRMYCFTRINREHIKLVRLFMEGIDPGINVKRVTLG